MCVQMSSESSLLRRRRFSRVLKPLLPRKLTSSARINLNRHWNEFEELYSPTSITSRVTTFDALDLQNELNDNALNEVREAAEVAARGMGAQSNINNQLKDQMLMTPPSTPNRVLPSPFNLPMEDDLADLCDLPLTPATPPQASWDIFFTFPSAPSAVCRSNL